MNDDTSRVRPAALMMDIAKALTAYGIDIDPEDVSDQAWLAVSALLLALGIEPLINDEDHSRRAEMVREALLTTTTATTTRPKWAKRS